MSKRELGDGEPSPDYKEFDDYDSFRSKHPRLYKFWNEYDEVLRIDPIWLKFALRFAESGAAQEVSPPSPEPDDIDRLAKEYAEAHLIGDWERRLVGSLLADFAKSIRCGAEGDTRELKAALAKFVKNGKIRIKQLEATDKFSDCQAGELAVWRVVRDDLEKLLG